MSNCRSSTNQNTRLFAPHVILKQDTNRLVLELKTGEGYSLPTFTAGDVIRYNPLTNSYLLSQADTESNAEVVGVVETASATSATVVVSGSINYPSSRLSAILDGGAGGKDVLFLDNTVAGGLTGTINLDDGTVKIVKPVLQLAPHSGYNSIVVNYIGYKTGSAASSDGDSFTSGVIFGPRGLDTDTWLNLENDVLLDVGDYSEIYTTYGTSGGPWRETVTVSSGTVNSSFVGQPIYQLTSGGSKQNTGNVVSVNTLNKTITVEKSANSDVMDTTLPVYVGGVPLVISTTEISQFTVPKIQTNENIVQDGEPLVPYLKLYNSLSLNIPSELSINTLTVANNLSVGNIPDLEAKITILQNQINQLNNRIHAF